ncbi:MAG: 5-oxoprolinase [Gammaproteobacteria bacterium]|nr:5-oxoprolinase [Gammaproteobacteria bacterium]
MNAIELKLFASRITAICDEMGAVLRRAAFSPNIRDRLDFSCALFGRDGRLIGQAAHIPVHLGSMAFAMVDLVSDRSWCPGDMLVVNDPYLGGTHLPDITIIAPVFLNNVLVGFVANRAHHANVGCNTPGSMPLAQRLEEEGIVIPPTLLFASGQLQQFCLDLLEIPGPGLSGDLAAQVGANQVGAQRLCELVNRVGYASYAIGAGELNDYADRIMKKLLLSLRHGVYRFEDFLDDDGFADSLIPLSVMLTIHEDGVDLDFSGSAHMVRGNLNCPESVVAAAVYYCFRCLLPEESPSCSGLFQRLKVKTKRGSILNAKRPAAVAAGNVETSTRLVDLIFGALAQALPEKIPAASQGTMNNVAMGRVDPESGERWDYYETVAGGLGAGPSADGLNCAQSHMTNTLNTPVEVLEMTYPLRVTRYAERQGSGGKGITTGGNGVIKEYEFLEPAQLTLLTERRRLAPWGLAGGEDGAKGKNLLNGLSLPGKCSLTVNAGDRLEIRTPGGGGWGAETQ